MPTRKRSVKSKAGLHGKSSKSSKPALNNGEERRIIKEIAVDKLLFDHDNPRLPRTAIDKNNEEAILRWMLKDASIIELMIAIGEKGYFPGEPVLVVPSRRDGYYDVIEGNRRLCAVKLLNKPEIAPTRQLSINAASEGAQYRPRKIPAIIYHRRREILDYLGYRHITGIKEWSPLAKARYLQDLRQSVKNLPKEEQFKSLARAIGSRANHVRRLLTGLAIFEIIERNNFFGLNLNEESISFAVLTTALGYPNLVEYIGLESGDDPDFKTIDLDKLKELTSWLFEKVEGGKTRLGESRNLGDLSAVVKSPKALAAFAQQGYTLNEAVAFTGAPTEIFRDSVNNARKNLSIANDTIHNVDEPSSSDSEALLDIIKIGRQLKTLVDSKIMGQDE